jgi:predicted DNA-binding transcriptional regulator AlpA
MSATNGAAISAGKADSRSTLPPTPAPLLIDVAALAVLLCRSPASLHRDDAAGRLPRALRIGGSKRWRLAEVVSWVEAGMPGRREWEVLRDHR